MNDSIEKILQKALNIQSDALQIIAWINQFADSRDDFKIIKPDFSKNLQFSTKEVIETTKKLFGQGQTKGIQKTGSIVLSFTEKEITKMPKQFKKDFRINRIKAHVRKRDNGRYEIRCQIKGQQITASHRLLEVAKEKFIERLHSISDSPEHIINKNVKLYDYMKKWLEIVKKPYIKPNTYKSYLQSFNAYIVPCFGNRELSSIKTFELQDFINKFTSEEKYRTAQKAYQLLCAVFDYAVSDNILQRSPMKKVVIAVYEQNHGTPLSRTEEKEFIQAFYDEPNVYRQALVFILYTGLRRSELASANISDKWVTVTTAKQRKGKKEKIRRIPVSPMLAKVLPLIDVNEILKVSPAVLTKRFKDYVPAHHLHDLRHTFITRCQECGIQRELVSLWAGHAADSSITSTVYTHLEHYEENQLKEIQKFRYIL